MKHVQLAGRIVNSYNGLNGFLLLVFLISLVSGSNAQNNRIRTDETIGWLNGFATINLNPKIGLHTEYQFRRHEFIRNWQQSLLRVGVNFKPGERVLFRLGYAWVETFPYGEIPINSMGKDFTEHRVFEAVQLNQKEGRFDLSHRFMLEQRFIGKYSSKQLDKEDEFPFYNRIRYMFRLQLPLKGAVVADKTPYLAMYDEVFIGFGKNVAENVFDQNRIGVLFGYNFNQTARVEAGYLNQIIQFGREINGQNAFQYNQGFIVNAYFNFNRNQ